MLRAAALRFIPAGAGNTMSNALRQLGQAVHPRGRGEHRYSQSPPRAGSGSSPRARGTHFAVVRFPGRRRFIPAGAGNTLRVGSGTWAAAVHPRGRGEHRCTASPSIATNGSSPRARGTHKRAHAAYLKGRFIPAGAGNTVHTHNQRPSTAVHPRGRGEHAPGVVSVVDVCGSSPRARGTQFGTRSQAQHARFIPAGAGNTASLRHTRRCWPVHPRGRGEHMPVCARKTIPIGSSPRARGTLPQDRAEAASHRFIPAGAGNTLRTTLFAARPTVHPRGRGEHAHPIQEARNENGSSPRARGTPLAGTGRHRGSAVHPRGRGEHLAQARVTVRTTGSSPRARGTPVRPGGRWRRWRFIPAGAGNTISLITTFSST